MLHAVSIYLELFPAVADFGDEYTHRVATGYLEAPPLTGHEGNSHTARVATYRTYAGDKKKSESSLILSFSFHRQRRLKTHLSPITH